MRALLLIALLVVAVSATQDYSGMFQTFKAKYGRVYSSESEHSRRFQIFTENMQKAERLQALNPQATFGMNEFADMSAAEFKIRHSAEKHFATVANKEGPAAEKVVGLPPSKDWRKGGAVVHVKNQGQCGSCWSFSTTGNIEGQWFLAGHTLTSLSEQELVSCDTVDQGCNGGLMDNAFNWLVNNRQGQIVTAESYPYVSGDGQVPSCSLSGKQFGAQINGHHDVAHDEATMATFMAKNGPLSIAVDATSWQTYTGGVMTNCQASQLDHGVLIVGFEATGSTPYWIIKNSWGPTWGEEGYIYVKYGSNECMLNNYPTTSLVNGSAPVPPTSPPSPPSPTTKPPTPSGGTFTQMQCTDSACSQGCMNHTFPQNKCLRTADGGSAIATCKPNELEMKMYMFSTDCTGFNIPESNPINQCDKDENGTYFENFCHNAAAVADSESGLRMPMHVANKLRRLRKH